MGIIEKIARRAGDLVFGPIGWVLDQVRLMPCRLGTHMGDPRPLSDGHFSRYCPRCGCNEWVDRSRTHNGRLIT